MGNVVGIGGKIVNPMAKQILSLTIDDSLQVNLQSQLPPEQVIKLLQSVMTDVMFVAIKNMIEAGKGPNLQ